MRIYTAHLRARTEPKLVREGFSWGALVFGPLWLLAQRAWIPAVLAFAAAILVGVLTAAGARIVLELGLAVLLGLVGHDLVRWSIARRGYVLAHVLAAGNAEAALARLLTARPDVAGAFMPAGMAR
ncbi:MAG TPA: DUF2628 domain-containing protein [Acetobacteraceae bacterium]|nr:DUF2628 domain-containing protein [Acetobacteraceae bacterium]